MKILGLPVLDPQTAPSSPDEGSSYYDSTLNAWVFWNGTSWLVTSA